MQVLWRTLYFSWFRKAVFPWHSHTRFADCFCAVQRCCIAIRNNQILTHLLNHKGKGNIFFLKKHRDGQLKPMERCKIWSRTPTNLNNFCGVFLSEIWKKIKKKNCFWLTQNTLFNLKGNNGFHSDQIILLLAAYFSILSLI